MVVEICSENCGVTMSPRISFSHNFSQLDVIPVEKHTLRSNSSGLSCDSSIDFDFCVQQESLDHESASSADELFSDGRILPIEIKNNNNIKKKNKNGPLKQKGLIQQEAIITTQPPPLPPLTRKNSRRESTKEKRELMNDEVDDQKQGSNSNSNSNSNSKSFWRFKRSSSCGNGYGRSLCPLPLLSRSNSTGSSPSVKRVPTISSSSKDGSNYNTKQNSHKNYYSHTTSRSTSSASSSYNHQIRPPLKKGHGPYASSNNNSVRVNTVLNVPPVNLFGLGSIFSNNRDKCKKK